MELLIRVFISFLKTSLSTSIVILLVLATLRILNNKINVRVKNALWILILIKLLIPVPVNINISDILNKIYTSVVYSQQAVTETNSYNIESLPFFMMLNNNTKKVNISAHQVHSYSPFIYNIMAALWLDGVILLSLFLLITQYKFIVKFQKKTNLMDTQLIALIENLKGQLSIKKDIPVEISDQIKSPCILGIRKPVIYIPEYIFKHGDMDQLSHIFLHELAHYKRKDLIYNFFGIIALILHWYNPLVWLAVKKIKLYRECTCDACVLDILNEDENIEYGLTLLNYSKLYLNKDKYAQLSIYYETNNQIKERIMMIKGFRKGSYKITGKVVLSCIIAAGIILSYNMEVKALNTDGILQTTSATLSAPGKGPGWYHENNNWYYKQIQDGVMDNFYCLQDGPNETEYWLFDLGKWFYFDRQGIMVNNTTLKIDGKDYVFEKNGVCTNKIYTGWVIDDSDNRWYYFDKNGVMLKNTTVDGNILDEDGKLIQAKEQQTSTDKSQYQGWYQENGKWYCKMEGDNKVKTWVGINGNWYYFDERGVMVSDTILNIEDKDYIFDADGICTNFADVKPGWNYDDGKWYYYDNNGISLKNTTVDGYKLDSDGVRVESDIYYLPDLYYILGADGSLNDLKLKDYYARDPETPDGWYSKNNLWYLKKDNNNLTGWIKHNHAWAYLDEHGILIRDTTLKINNKDYSFDINGVCTNKLD